MDIDPALDFDEIGIGKVLLDEGGYRQAMRSNRGCAGVPDKSIGASGFNASAHCLRLFKENDFKTGPSQFATAREAGNSGADDANLHLTSLRSFMFDQWRVKMTSSINGEVGLAVP